MSFVNEASWDRVARVILGVLLLGVVALTPLSWWGLVGLVGLVPLVTGLAGFCPIYRVFGVGTCAIPSRHG